MAEVTLQQLDYAPWEAMDDADATRTPSYLRFPHEYVGHRYLAVGGAVGGVPGGIGGVGGFGGVAGVAGGPGAYAAAAAAAAASGTAPGAGDTGGGASIGGVSVGVGIGGLGSPVVLPVGQGVAILSPEPTRAPVVIPQTGAVAGPLTTSQPSPVDQQIIVRPAPQPLPTSTPIGPGPQPSYPIAPYAPIGPGPQPGLSNVKIDMRDDCQSCGQLRAQREQVQQSIQLERQQQQQQQIQQQERQIQQIQQQERQPGPSSPAQIDQQIQQKIQLLQQIDAELAKAGAPPPGTVPMVPPPGQQQETGLIPAIESVLTTLQGQPQGLVTNTLEHILKRLAPMISDQLAKELADALYVLTPPGLAEKVYNLIQQYLNPGGQSGGSPTLPPPVPSPPPAPSPVEFCVTCESAEDALKYQAGEGGAKCYLVEGSYKDAASMYDATG